MTEDEDDFDQFLEYCGVIARFSHRLSFKPTISLSQSDMDQNPDTDRSLNEVLDQLEMASEFYSFVASIIEKARRRFIESASSPTA